MSEEELTKQIENMANRFNIDTEMMDEFKRQLDIVNLIALSSTTLVYTTNLYAIITGAIAMGFALGYSSANGEKLDMSIWGAAFNE